MRVLSAFALGIFALTLLSVPALTASAATIPIETGASCLTAGSTGLNASIVVNTNNEVLNPTTVANSGVVVAGNCNVGIFVAPDTTGVVISGLTISNATDHGIFVQDASNITITGNTVTMNPSNPGLRHPGCSVPPAPVVPNCINEDKGIEIVGTSNSNISNNVVTGNLADGGIGIADDGAIDPGAPSPGGSFVAANNTVSDNMVIDNAFGCGIVVASYNAFTGVVNNTVIGNHVYGNSVNDSVIHLPFVGGIVIAADTPNSLAVNNSVIDNTVNGSLIPGVVIHANAPGDVVNGTTVEDNILSFNGIETSNSNEPFYPTGIMVVAEIPGLTTIENTYIHSNIVNNNNYSVWYCNTNPTITDQEGSVTLIGVCPPPPQPPSGVPEFPLGTVGFAGVLAVCLLLLVFLRKRVLNFPHPSAPMSRNVS